MGYYMRDEVRREIVDYSKGRWMALEAPYGGGRLFIRYDRGVPLSVSSDSDYISLFERFSRFSFRTIYATANVYRDITADGLRDESNVLRVTPVFDVDASLEDWRITLKAAEEIVRALERHGVVKSVYLKWSGRGLHVHINENAFSEEVLQRYGPVTVARAVVDLIISEVSEKVTQLSRSARNADRELRVENRMDIQRVFTVPLSLHRFRRGQAAEGYRGSWKVPDNGTTSGSQVLSSEGRPEQGQVLRAQQGNILCLGQILRARQEGRSQGIHLRAEGGGSEQGDF